MEYLTITNGSIISETLPKGMVVGAVILDYSVFVPAGSANGYGYATVSAHALISGKQGNIPAYGIDNVENASIYIRNLAAFYGGADAYSVKYVTQQDKQRTLWQARSLLLIHINEDESRPHYPCKEAYLYEHMHININWQCQFVTYNIPSYMHVIRVTIQGKNLVINVWYVVRPTHVWVK